MTLSAVTSNTTALASALNQYRNHLQGEASSTEAWLLRCATGADFIVVLADAAGARKLSVRDSGNVEVAYIDSDGNLSVTGLTLSTFTFPTAASPTPTTEGQASWDTDDNLLSVGDGAATKIIIPTPTTTAGDIEYASGARAHSRLAIGTAGQVLKVNSGATAPEWGGMSVSDAVRADFRANRRLVAVWAAGTTTNVGVGFGTVGGSITTTTISGENLGTVNAVTTARVLGAASGTGAISPAKSPRMHCRLQFPASSANNTHLNIGFFDTGGPTSNGAMLRLVTTGNVFFVTRTGGAETVTDLGALSRTTILGFEIETADAGVTWVCRNQAGTVLATHTTNVPTAGTAINYGFDSVTATAGVTHGVAYMYVEGTFA